MSGLYHSLIYDDYHTGRYPSFTNSKHISLGNNIDNSQPDFLCLLHRLATNHGIIDPCSLTIQSSLDESYEPNFIPINQLNPQNANNNGTTDNSPQSMIEKISNETSSGLFSSKYQQIKFNIQIKQTNSDNSNFIPLKNDLEITQDDLKSLTITKENNFSDNMNEFSELILNFLETEKNGKTLESIFEYLQRQTHSVFLINNLNILYNLLFHEIVKQNIFCILFYDFNYEKKYYFVHKIFLHLYYFSLDVFDHLRYESISSNNNIIEFHSFNHFMSIILPLSVQELQCPWMQTNGTKNIKLFTFFVSKILSTLTIKPFCTISVLHSELPMLSYTHVAILIQIILKNEIIIKKKLKLTNKLKNPFEKISFNKKKLRLEKYIESDDDGSVEDDDWLFRDYCFIIHSNLWKHS